MFNTLEFSAEGRKRQGAAFVLGLLAQTLVVAVAILLGVLFPEELPMGARQYLLVWLPPLTPPPAAPVVKHVPKIVRVVIPKPNSLEVPPPPPPVVAKLELPKIPPKVISPTLPRIPELPLPVAVRVPPRPAPKVQAVVKTGTFGGAPEPVTTKRPKEQVQTGGFGSPQGLPGHAQGGNPGNVPILGSFGLPEGPGVGNGTGGRHGIQGVVASVGFGSGIAGNGYGRGGAGGGGGGGGVSTGAFEKVAQVQESTLSSNRVELPAEFQAVEILSKPAPVYTQQAIHLRVQGDVVLSVVFQANGVIQVNSVVKSLGYGLDQAAVQAASKIRYKPALRGGQPTDFPATLRIQFRLADQST
jgi:TonB family protein